MKLGKQPPVACLVEAGLVATSEPYFARACDSDRVAGWLGGLLGLEESKTKSKSPSLMDSKKPRQDQVLVDGTRDRASIERGWRCGFMRKEGWVGGSRNRDHVANGGEGLDSDRALAEKGPGYRVSVRC